MTSGASNSSTLLSPVYKSLRATYRHNTSFSHSYWWFNLVSERNVWYFAELVSDPNLMQQFRFPSPPPVYMWFDTADDSASHALPFTVHCGGSFSVNGTRFEKGIFRNTNIFREPYIPEDFGPDLSGVYQCATWNEQSKSVWYQRTTYVLVTGTFK